MTNHAARASAILTFMMALACLEAVMVPLAVQPVDIVHSARENIFYLPFITRNPGCLVVYQSPADGSFLMAGQPFIATWVLRNLTDQTWTVDHTVVRFTGGMAPDESLTEVPLAYDVSPGFDYQFSISMIAPAELGVYVSAWGIYEGEVSLCRFYMAFRVP